MKTFLSSLSWFLLAIHHILPVINAIKTPLKTYTCGKNEDGFDTCQLNNPAETTTFLSHGACLVTCGKGNIWPYPTGDVNIGTSVQFLNISTVKMPESLTNLESAEFSRLTSAMNENFLRELNGTAKSRLATSGPAKFSLSITGSITDLNTQASTTNDESYTLQISTIENEVTVTINAATAFGYRHGLETLLQLIFWDDLMRSVGIVSSAFISDKPAFPYRGIMIDVSRHFISLSKIKESVRALGYNKMNVLHLHLSDTASFPVTISSRPEVTSYGAYDDDKIFTPESIAELVSFATSYGVMILPEIDVPAHVSAGWQWGPSAGLGNLIVCDDAYGNQGKQWNTDSLEPPSGQLNLANEHAYELLNDIYSDVLRQFPSPIFHIGGDEVIVGSDTTWASCYNNSVLGKEIIEFIESKGLSRQDSSTFYQLWENFTMRATELIKNQYSSQNIPLTKLHIWGGGGVDDSGVCYNLLAQPNVESFLPPSLFTIQVWDETTGSIIPDLIQKGYSVILSNTDYVYLDCGNAGFTNPGGYWCQPYHEWFHIYQYISDVRKKWKLTNEQLSFISGSETLIWTEMVDDQSISQKLWPRSAALAESLWTNPQNHWYEASARFQQWRNTLVARGIAAEALQPLWCQQRDGWVCNINSGTPS
jgi:hexosaminidase